MNRKRTAGFKRSICKWFGHKWRIRRIEYDRFVLQCEKCQRCGEETELIIEPYETPAYQRRSSWNREQGTGNRKQNGEMGS